jgi:hypothetical protein
LYDLSKINIEFLTETAERIEDVSDDAYFGAEYKNYISNSLLKLINPEEGGAPTRFLEGFSGSSSSSALELGSAVHQMILEKEKHFLSPVDKPSGKVGLICDTFHVFKQVEDLSEDEALLKACEEHDYYKGKLTEKKLEDILLKGKEYIEFLNEKSNTPGVIVLTELQKEKLFGCLESVKNNQLLLNLLLPIKEDDLGLTTNVQSYNEDVMIMDFIAHIPDDDNNFESIELKLKAKIDNWSIDFDNKILTLNDLKTTGKPLNTFPGIIYQASNMQGESYNAFMKGSFQNYHYYRQMAMYAFILKTYAKKTYDIDDTWKLRINMLVVETNKPYMSHVFGVGNRWIKTGYHEFINLLKRVAFHKAKGFDTFVEMSFDNITEIE